MGLLVEALAQTVEQVLAGNRRALARLITRVENGGAEAQAALGALHPHTGRAHVVGITGAPGSGKSTLVNQLALGLRRQGLRVGIVAVDPSSPFSGGALLGDRVRMRDLAGDPGIFIRSMATRGHLGGLAGATRDVVKLLDAAGFERVLVETVGVGQSEIEIARAAHTTVVIEAPGMGDDVQALKAGVLEIADVLAVNKADHPGADATVRALQMALDLGFSNHGGQATADETWRPPLLQTVALDGRGVPELLQAVERHRDYLLHAGLWQERERQRAADELESTLRDLLLAQLRARIDPETWDAWLERIVGREVDLYAAAYALMGDES